MVASGGLESGFEENKGQLPPAVQFAVRQKNLTVLLTQGGLVMSLTPSRAGSVRKTGGLADSPAGSVRMKLIKSSRVVKPVRSGKVSAVTNYYLGSDPAKWASGVPSFSRVRYPGVYEGIDLLYHIERGEVEYDFMLRPGADPGKIALAFEGARRITVDRRGDLILHLPEGKIRQSKPFAYQIVKGSRKKVAGRFLVDEQRQVRFSLGRYDRSRPLVIDPVITYGSYLGGSGDDFARAIEVDDAGDPYIAGSTTSPDFPTLNPAQAAPAGKTEVFIAKLNPQGTDLVYATYIGGAEDDAAHGLAIDAGGNAYVSGVTNSNNFPGTGRAGSSDAFVAKLTPSGALAWSKQLGGPQADEALGVDVDEAGNSYITGSTTSATFPTTAGSHDRTCGTDGKCNEKPGICLDGRNTICPAGSVVFTSDAFVSKFSNDGALTLSTFVGEAGADEAKAIAVDGAGSPYVTGFGTITPSAGAYDTQRTQGPFVVKLSPEFSAPSYATYLGFKGSNCQRSGLPLLGGRDIALDESGRAYVTGNAEMNGQKIFVVRLDPSGAHASLSMTMGGVGCNQATGISVDAEDNILFSAATSAIHSVFNSANNFPAKDPIEPPSTRGGPGRYDAVLVKLAPDGGTVYSTTLGGAHHDGVEMGPDRVLRAFGGVDVDSAGNAYVTGGTYSTDFPWTNAPQREVAGGADAFILRIAPGGMPVPAVSSVAPRGGSRSGGDEVKVSGTGFGGAAAVRFGSAQSPRFSVNAAGTEITATAPPHAEGAVAVTVEAPGGTSLGYSPSARFHYGEGSWGHGGVLSGPKYGHSATLLDGLPCRQAPSPDWCGKVLVAGGIPEPLLESRGQPPRPLKEAELYDPRTNTWSHTKCAAGVVTSSCPADMHFEHFGQAAALLPDSRVLVVGGPAKAEIYNPADGTWKIAAPPIGPEASQKIETEEDVILDETADVPIAGGYAPTLTVLPEGPLDFCGIHCGKVLLAGGGRFPEPYADTFEGSQVYDPSKDEWMVVGPLNESRYFHRALLLTAGQHQLLGTCGKVILLGGRSGTGMHRHSDPSGLETFDPATGVWTKKNLWRTPRYFNSFNLMGDGKLLVAGGMSDFANGNGSNFPAYIGSAETYDPAADTWSPAASLKTPRYGHAAATLPDGKVFVVGGTHGGPLSSAEIYDPAAKAWKWAGSTVAARTGQNLDNTPVPAGMGPTATLLSDGRVLIVGGSGEPFAEIYTPADQRPYAPAPAAPCGPPRPGPADPPAEEPPPGTSNHSGGGQTSTGGGSKSGTSAVLAPSGPGSLGSANPASGTALSPPGGPPLGPGAAPALSSSPALEPVMSPGSASSVASSASGSGSSSPALSSGLAAGNRDDAEPAPSFHMVGTGGEGVPTHFLGGAAVMIIACAVFAYGSRVPGQRAVKRSRRRHSRDMGPDICPALAQSL